MLRAPQVLAVSCPLLLPPALLLAEYCLPPFFPANTVATGYTRGYGALETWLVCIQTCCGVKYLINNSLYYYMLRRYHF